MDKSPHQIAEERITLAEEYSRFSGEYAKMIKSQADHFNLKRAEFKSDNACQKAFDVTDDGVKMAVLKMKLKSIQVTLSALKTALENAENEARGLY